MDHPSSPSPVPVVLVAIIFCSEPFFLWRYTFSAQFAAIARADELKDLEGFTAKRIDRY
jgi:hypothetical protein